MTDLEARLRATYTAVAERTSAAEWSGLRDADVVELRPTVKPPGARRTVWRAAAAAVVLLLAGAVAVVRWDDDATTAPHRNDRPIAIPMAVPTGFGLVAWGAEGGSMIGFPERPPAPGVAYLLYLGPDDAFLNVTSAPSAPDPNPTRQTVALSSGVEVHVNEAETTTLAWVTPTGTAVSMSTKGIALDELLRLAELIWYATPEGFAAATSKDGFGRHTFERWRPPGDRFDGSELRLVGALQDETGRAVTTEYFIGQGMPLGPFTECLASTSADGAGHVMLFGPGGTTAFVVTLPNGTERRQPAGSPPWSSVSTYASIAVADAGTEFDSQPIQVTCEVGQ